MEQTPQPNDFQRALIQREDAILAEMKQQTKTLKTMNTAIQIIAVIILLAAIGSCALAFMAPSLR